MKSPQAITDTELAVLKLLWDRGPLTARAITESIYPTCTSSDIGTVHSMLQRLEAKQMVLRDRGSHAHVFTASVQRSEIAGQQLETIAEKLADGSMAPFLTHLVSTDRLTRDEIDELRNLLDQHAKKKR